MGDRKKCVIEMRGEEEEEKEGEEDEEREKSEKLYDGRKKEGVRKENLIMKCYLSCL